MLQIQVGRSMTWQEVTISMGNSGPPQFVCTSQSFYLIMTKLLPEGLCRHGMQVTRPV